MRNLLVTLLLAVATTLVAGHASARDKEIQVLGLGSPDAFDNAKALTGALRRAVLRAQGWALARGDFSLEVLSIALDCPEPPDAACLARMAKKMKVKRFVWGTVRKQSQEQIVAELKLWESGSQQRETRIEYSIHLNDETDDALLELAEGAFGELVGEATGTLTITAGSIDGEVLVGGEPVGEMRNGRAEVEVRSGRVEVLVRAPGQQPLRGTVVVPAAGSANLALAPAAAAAEPAPAAPVGPAPVDASAEPGPSAGKIWGYAGLGVGIASIAAGGFFWWQSYSQSNDPDFERYVNATPHDEDPCERARSDPTATEIVDICDANKTSRTMAYVMVPVGVALTTVGAILLATSDSSGQASAGGVRQSRIRPALRLAPTGGGVDLSVTF